MCSVSYAFYVKLAIFHFTIHMSQIVRPSIIQEFIDRLCRIAVLFVINGLKLNDNSPIFAHELKLSSKITNPEHDDGDVERILV